VEFLVELELRVPEGTPESEVEQHVRAEAAHPDDPDTVQGRAGEEVST
jgi:hypothetical protein